MNRAIVEARRCCMVAKKFGFDYGISAFFNKFIFRNEKIFFSLKDRHYKHIVHYLNKRYSESVIYDVTCAPKKISSNSNIWIFWWQGEKEMPQLVKRAVESIKKNAGDHRVIFLSKENLNEYVNLPSKIMEKFASGIISITHFSDIIRFYLLYTYGGIWMDATIYLEHEFDSEIYNYSLYTIKHDLAKYLCLGKWSTFFWGCGKGNPFCKYVYDMVCTYWSKEDYAIDYFLLDCVIRLSYENIPSIRKEIDAIPMNNKELYSLEENFNSKKAWKDAETYIYKLSNKKKHISSDIEGSMTNYGIFIKG